MVDLVAARRQQWKLLRASALNPSTSSPLVRGQSPQSRPAEGEGEGEKGVQEEERNGKWRNKY